MKNNQTPIRILHIGNVANYGYNISKIVQGNHIVSHTISWDYYHINAQPVWEEGVFDAGAIGDHYFPSLPLPKESGFAAPEWYVQGPRILACLALIARNEGKQWRAAFFQRALDSHLRELPSPAYRAKMAAGRQRIMELAYSELLGGFGKRHLLSAVARFPLRLFAGSGLGAGLIRRKWVILNRLDALRSAAKRLGAKLPAPVKIRIKAAINALPMLDRTVYGRNTVDLVKNLQTGTLDAKIENKPKIADVSTTSIVKDMASGASIDTRRASAFEDRVQALIAQYKAVYPERDFDPMLLRQYEHTLPLMQRLFSHYDLVIGYAIEGIWPLMAGVPYVAYEFGTIRNLPFQDSATGRLAALTYLNCEQIIVTNSDNEAPAKQLGRPYFFLPHVVNESGLLDAEMASAARAAFLAEHGGNFIVFHPPRQHWDEKRDTSWDKGNDHLFRGFARLVKEHAPQARCVAVMWGDSLKRSQELIGDLGITENVVWITPQPHIAMMHYIGICDVLCDQFTIPTFGGIPPKAFHAGKPVVTSFDPELHNWCFEEPQPLIPANSTEQIYSALVRLYTDKNFADALGQKGMDWYRRENSNVRIREVLLRELKLLKPMLEGDDQSAL